MRRIFALAVLAIHAVLLWWVMSGIPPRLPHEEPAIAYFIQWIPETEPVPTQPVPAEAPRAVATQSSTRSIPPVTDQSRESREDPMAPSVPDPTPTPISAEPKVNWAQEGTLAAQRAAERSGNGQQKTFSPLPKSPPEPCKPKESSMEWNGEEDRRVTWVGPMPVFRFGNCIVTLGAFACSGGQSEVNGHLLDDMRKPDRARSSVPDAHICD